MQSSENFSFVLRWSLGFFNLSTLKTRRNYFSIIVLYKLIRDTVLHCPRLLEKINFKINYKNSRNKTHFLLIMLKPNIHFLLQLILYWWLEKVLILDLFCRSIINDINSALNL